MMQNQIRLLRSLLVAQFGLTMIGAVLDLALTHQLPPAVQEFNQQLGDAHSWPLVILGLGCLLLGLLGLIGLFLLRPWAKAAYLVALAGVILVTLFGPPTAATPGAASALYDLGNMAAGATVLLLCGTEFGRSWKTVRTRAAI